MEIATINGLYELGKSLALMGNIKEADEKFKQAIEAITDKGQEDLLYTLYKSRLDINVDNEEERNEISAVMNQIFSGEDAYKEKLFYDLAQVHKMTGDRIRYIDALQKIIERVTKPEQSVYFELAMMQQDMNDMSNAAKNYIQFLNLAGKKHASTVIAATNLSACYNAINQPERAVQTLKRYLNLK